MITQSQLKERLHYCPDTGVFTWINPNKMAHSIKNGDTAGCITREGYIAIKIYGGSHKAHRLAFLYMTGSMPENSIDHENQKKDDNRWSNIRQATHAENSRNRPIAENNTSGFTGVYWNKLEQKWKARVTCDGIQRNLGTFEKIEDAIEARKAANIKYGYHPNHGAKKGLL